MKTASKILMTMGLVVLFAGYTFSQGTSTASPAKDTQKTQTTATAPGKFVDTNKNGICDNHEGRAQTGKGANFVDKNGDGKCDNCGAVCTGNKKGNCCGQGNQHRNGCGQGQGKCSGKGQGFQHRHGCSQGSTTTPANQSTDKTR